MVDWTSGTSDASVAERDSAFLPLRVPGSPDVFKEAAVSGFLTKNAGGTIDTAVAGLLGLIIAENSFAALTADGTRSMIGSLNSGLGFTAGSLFIQPRGGVGASIVFGTDASVKVVIESGGNFRPGTDNIFSCGTAIHRWANVYAATGSISTSDEREKTWRSGLTDAEYAAGCALMAELGFFQWTEEIEKKGADGARYHFGARAQRVWSICAEHGLAPKLRKNGQPDTGLTPVAFLCFDEWGEESEDEFADFEIEVDEEISQPTGKMVEVDGKAFELSEIITRKATRIERRATGGKVIRNKAGNRFGLRVDELNSFLIAVQARRQDELDARITALEA